MSLSHQVQWNASHHAIVGFSGAGIHDHSDSLVWDPEYDPLGVLQDIDRLQHPTYTATTARGCMHCLGLRVLRMHDGHLPSCVPYKSRASSGTGGWADRVREAQGRGGNVTRELRMIG